MSRNRQPLRRSSKDQSKQNIMYLIILVLLIIFFATIGFKFVINASLWLSGNGSTDSTTEQKSDTDELLLAPELYDAPDATNSAEIRVSGRGTLDTTLRIYVNDAIVDTMKQDQEDFEASIPLENGTNTIYLQTKDAKRKQSKDSEIYTVLVLKEKPSLSIASPKDGEVFDKDTTTLSGETDQNVSIHINGAPVVVAADGTFKKELRLKEGDNQLTVRATDIAGNTEVIEMKIRYEKD